MSPARRAARSRSTRWAALTACAITVLAATQVVSDSGANAAVAGFAAGDVVVYRVGDGATALGKTAARVYLDEYSTAGSQVQSVALPTAASGANKILTASGTAGSEGGLTLSGDSRFLVATGYNAAVGAADPSAATSATVTRTIASVSASDVIDSSTSLNNVASANNVRSAASSDGSKFWVAGADAASGVQYAADGASAGTPLVSSTYKNGRQVLVSGGQLYLGADPTKASVTVATVGTGLPTSGTNAVTNLAFATGAAPVQPYGYSFLTLGTGTAPDTLYVADNSAGAIVKYVLSSGTWSKKGSVAIAGVTGVTANDNNGTVSIYATSTNATGTSGILSAITDSSGLGGTLSGSATTIATAPANEAFRGVAFAPGTVIGSGSGAPPPTPPTINPAYAGLPATLNDTTNPTLAIAVADVNYPASQLTVTATSSNTSVAPQSGVSISGTGATRTLTVTPAAVGYSTITLTVNAPDGTSATTTISYGASAYLGDPSDRYFDGAGNLSTAIDVGSNYMLVADDANDIIRLYNEQVSGQPVKTFDFTGQLPFGTTSVDMESSTRIGNTIYWTGSMTNTSSGNLAPARSTLFAATVSGSGANTTLTYQGAYTGLKADFANWDHTNGHGLGADYFGLTASQAAGVLSHDPNAFDVEGMEAVQGSSTSAYLAFRAPQEPTSNRHLALVVPVTNLTSLTNGTATTATFGKPLQWDLGGLGVREIRKNANGQYLIIAGTSDGSNTSFVLYSWDGNPAHPPLSTGLSLPLTPAGANQGSWETIVNVPDNLTDGSPIQLVEDDGNTAWYGDSATSKDTLLPALQKDLGRTFTYSSPTKAATTTTISSSGTDYPIGQQVTYTGTVAPSVAGTPNGTITFRDGGTPITGCTALALDSNLSATCNVTYPHAATHNVTATYDGDSTYATSTSTVLTVSVHPYTLTITANDQAITYGSADPSFTYTVGGLMNGDQLTTPPTCGVTGTHTAVGSYPIVCSGADAGSDYTIVYKSGTLTVSQATPTVTLTADVNPAVTGQPVTFTATVAGAGATPTGTVAFTSGGTTIAGCGSVSLGTGTATCTVSGGFHAGTYSIGAAYSGDSSYTSGTPSTAFTETVNRASTGVKLVASPGSPAQYDTITLTATVAAVSPGAGSPSGTVAFADPAGTISGCSAQPVSSTGVATCSASESRAGTVTFTATYSGDTDFLGSTVNRDVVIAQGRAATLTLTPTSSTIASGATQTYTVTATDSQGRALGDVTASTTFAISPDGTCTANACTAAAAGAHTVTATNGPASATATLTVSAGSSIQAPRDVVGVGDQLSQYGFEFFADGSPGVAGGYNPAGNLGRVETFDATGDADGRAVYGSPGTDGTSSPYDPSAILDPGSQPAPRPQSSSDGIGALLADTTASQIQFARSSRLPTAADQSRAAANGWGGLHVVRYATGDVRIAVARAATNAPSGLSPAELVKIYNGSWTTWGDVPGYQGPASGDRIIALLPAAGSDTRAAFDADLAAANGGTAVQYAGSVRTVPADDYTQIVRQSTPADAIMPFSGSALTLLGQGYFASAPITGLNGTAPDSAPTYDGTHALYVIVRDSDIARVAPIVGSSKNWAQLLFVGPSAVLSRSAFGAQLSGAGLTPSYADLGDVNG